MKPDLNIKPDIKLSVKQTFGIDTDMEIDPFSKKNEFALTGPRGPVAGPTPCLKL